MSEPQHGERVDDPRGVDEVVGSANANLADAEAASRAAIGEDDADRSTSPAADDAAKADSVETVAAEPLTSPADAVDRPTANDDDSDDLIARYAAYSENATARYPAQDDATLRYPTVADDATAALYPTPVEDTTARYPEVVTPSEPVVPAAQQPIFVQAPEAPRPRGNRGAAGAIGLLAAVSFGILYLGTALGLRLASGESTMAALGQDATAALTSWWLWVPVAVFFIAFWLLGAIINRGRWGVWVVLGILVGLASYGGHILGELFQAPFWALTARQGTEIVESQLLAPLAIAAFIIGRELTVWFGAWVAARGKRVTEINREMQREYERTLEAGPQLRQG